MNQPYYPDQQTMVRRRAIILALIATIIYAFIWMSRQASIELVISNPGKGTISYELSSGDKKSSGKFKDGTAKKKLSAPRGNYEVLVTQGESSYYKVVKTGGFFKKTSVNGSLTKENNRTFIGDNPDSCLDYVGGLLISGGCSGLYSKMVVHVPSTSNVPTYTLADAETASKFDSTGVVDETMEGIVSTTEGVFGLIQIPEVGETVIASHSIFSLKPDALSGRATLVRTLPNANVTNTYRIQKYKQGFITYDSTFGDLSYHATAAADPSAIKLDGPQNNTLLPISLDSHTDQLLILYSNADAASSNKKIKLSTEIVIGEKGSATHFGFKKSYVSAVLCGDKKVCLLGGSTLDIYDISGKNARLVNSLADVRAIQATGNIVFIAKQDGVIRFDTTNHTGYRSLSFDGYGFNDMRISGNGYVINLSDSRGKKVALLLDSNADSTGEIDKKLNKLKAKESEISSLSAYGLTVFITPDLGELEYDNTTGFFGYNAERKKEAAAKIDKAVADAGIDTSKFKIINTSL